MNNKIKKYEFLKHLEKNNPPLLEVKTKRFFSVMFFIAASLLIGTVAFIPSKLIAIQFGLNVTAFVFFFLSYFFSRRADEVNLNINLNDLRTFIDWNWLFDSSSDFKNIEKLQKNFNPINFLDSKFKINGTWEKNFKKEKELKETFDNWIFLDKKVDFSTVESKNIKTNLYDLFLEIDLKKIPDVIKYPIFYEYVRNFGTEEQLEFVRKYVRSTALLPELQNIKMIENITYEKALRNLSLEGKTRNMKKIKEITEDAVKEYSGCGMEIEYRNVTQIIERFLKEILNKKEENVI